MTVRELVAAFEKVFGREVPTREAPSRPGDVPGAFANVDRAHELLGWQPRAVARGGHRLGAGLGREAPGDPGLRVTQVRSPRPGLLAAVLAVGSAPRLPAASRRHAGVSSSTGTTAEPMPLAGKVIVLDAGHQLGNHNFPEEINRLVPAGGFSKPCNTTGRRPTAATPRRRSPGRSR